MNKFLLKRGQHLIFIGVVLYFIQNTYFGWNELPTSKAEEITDTIIKVIVYCGWCTYFFPMFALYEKNVKKLDK